MMVQRGVAPSTDKIIAQLNKKFPVREKPVRWPRKDRIDDLRNLVEKITNEMEVDDRKNEIEEPKDKSGALESESLRELKEPLKTIFRQFKYIGRTL